MTKKREKAEELILIAATKVFTQNGYKGATMRIIAEEADINLAMLNYYFKSKENLFNIVFENAVSIIGKTLEPVVLSDLDLFDKIEALVDAYISAFIEHAEIPLFVFSELRQNLPLLAAKLEENTTFPLLILNLSQQFDKEVKEGRIRQIEIVDFMLNLFGMCVFPFIGKPMVQSMLKIDELSYGAAMERRKKSVSDFVINAIKI